jgi:hypothetical protein
MSFRTTAAARQKEMNASMAVEATRTRWGLAAGSFGGADRINLKAYPVGH